MGQPSSSQATSALEEGHSRKRRRVQQPAQVSSQEPVVVRQRAPARSSKQETRRKSTARRAQRSTRRNHAGCTSRVARLSPVDELVPLSEQPLSKRLAGRHQPARHEKSGAGVKQSLSRLFDTTHSNAVEEDGALRNDSLSCATGQSLQPTQILHEEGAPDAVAAVQPLEALFELHKSSGSSAALQLAAGEKPGVNRCLDVAAEQAEPRYSKRRR
ncbi:hypothetical protein V8C86DRAFT_2458069 [Haematococcus lacustris]